MATSNELQSVFNRDERQIPNDRRKMVEAIANMLWASKPNAPSEWMKKVPQMARRCEESLFRDACTFEEYKDARTLKQRLSSLAREQANASQSSAVATGGDPPMWYVQSAHINDRSKMVSIIASMLRARKPNVPSEWMKKVPQMARRCEESLFRDACTFEEYKDARTLKQRLRSLAVTQQRVQQQVPQQLVQPKQERKQERSTIAATPVSGAKRPLPKVNREAEVETCDDDVEYLGSIEVGSRGKRQASNASVKEMDRRFRKEQTAKIASMLGRESLHNTQIDISDPMGSPQTLPGSTKYSARTESRCESSKETGELVHDSHISG